jgi:hypothetical protein
MSAAESQVEVDFVRYVGVRVVDAGSDERGCKIVDGARNVGLRADAALLAISNQFGVIFIGTADGFQWGWLARLRGTCAADVGIDVAASKLTAGANGLASPFILALSSSDTHLAVCTDGSVSVYAVQSVLSEQSVTALFTHALASNGRVEQFQVVACTRPSRA